MQDSPWKDGFLFLANQAALDLLNTRPVQDGSPAELLPDFAALLRWFQAAELIPARTAAELQRRWAASARARRTLAALLEWRERLRHQIEAWEEGAAVRPAMVEELNHLMAEHPMHARLKPGSGGLAMVTWFHPRCPEDLFAPLAHSAAALFATVDRQRVRRCGHCILHFLDTSKKGTRRWCSMQLCGNRLKVAAYAARRRAGVRSDALGVRTT